MSEQALGTVYRDSSEVEVLRTEVEKLRAELTSLRGEELYPFSDDETPCRKCGGHTVAKRAVEGPKNTFTPTDTRVGPTRKFEAAIMERWWREGVPERFRRHCRREDCGAVYYERTKA